MLARTNAPGVEVSGRLPFAGIFQTSAAEAMTSTRVRFLVLGAAGLGVAAAVSPPATRDGYGREKARGSVSGTPSTWPTGVRPVTPAPCPRTKSG